MNDDPFLEYVKKPRNLSADHAERAHSKFSASGAERWFNCPGNVALSEGIPDRTNIWAKEGTEAHEVLEKIMLKWIEEKSFTRDLEPAARSSQAEMWRHGFSAARFITDLHAQTPDSDILVETRIRLDFIHPEMFGTFDGAVLDYFGTLHVFDYKYGVGVPVSPKNNLQMIFYGIGLAHQHHWNFKRVRLWIIQPRVKAYDGPLFWELSIPELKAYVDDFRAAVKRVEENPNEYNEGSWCHWCKAKSICPKKTEGRLDKARSIFSIES